MKRPGTVQINRDSSVVTWSAHVIHPPVSKGLGPLVGGFQGGQSLSDLALTQPTPSKPLAFPPPPPLNSAHA